MTGKKHCLVLFRVVKMTVKTSQKLPCVHIWVYSQNRQLADFDPYSDLPLKSSTVGLKIYRQYIVHVHVQHLLFYQQFLVIFI